MTTTIKSTGSLTTTTVSCNPSEVNLKYLMNISKINNNSEIEYDRRMADTLMKSVLELWSTNSHCDLTIYLKQHNLNKIAYKRYRAHRFVLSSVCDSINIVKEERKFSRKKTINYVCYLDYTPNRGLELLLVYLYSSRLVLDIESVSDLLIASNELGVKHVFLRCIQFIWDYIDDLLSIDVTRIKQV
ncbi:unnamed protein product [Didymodactylos carnosus]|uniref:BTB domain-containing protein n=1 Tax=Didymodactylos carnosus TaxID=1234261 RepID=A0A815QH95_9BILA|nr:unnamed protein product [Didymodactylos carnosus]CAF1559034.1 unnamed protein product [Didymodactylos carnosus]CAF4333530.1 unnamed protein product [Didymodactylos carnosus]CAF4350502.1 unnamed protein product [Didymodactylos carnosus]